MFITAVCVIFLIILSNNTLKSFIKSIRIGKGWGGGGGAGRSKIQDRN